MADTRPQNCRFRLQDEGKAYPRSSCQACGATITTGLGTRCTKQTTDTKSALPLALYQWLVRIDKDVRVHELTEDELRGLVAAVLAEAENTAFEKAAKVAEQFEHPIESRQRRWDNGRFRTSDRMQLVPTGADIAKAIRAMKGTTDV